MLFRSVVSVYGGNLLGVVRTGMGQDGMRGCGLIRERGGRVVVQDEVSSVVWGMPGSVVQAGCADAVLPWLSFSWVGRDHDESGPGLPAGYRGPAGGLRVD